MAYLRFLLVAAGVLLAYWPAMPAAAQAPAKPAATPAQAPAGTPPPGSAFTDFLANMWARLRAATPRTAPSAQASSVTAGLRGKEATESELKPYWKDDRGDDPAAAAERQALDGAQTLAEAGKFAEAAQAFDTFLKQYPSSPLAANAIFGGALARAAMGDKARARAGFEDFLKRAPQHPLAHDAEQALASLR